MLKTSISSIFNNSNANVSSSTKESFLDKAFTTIKTIKYVIDRGTCSDGNISNNLEKSNDNEFIRKHRKFIEDKAEEINPNLAKVVRKTINLSDTVNNPSEAIDYPIKGQEIKPEERNELICGDHLFIYAPGFTHHGLYVGYDMVIHYSHGPDGKLSIRKDTLDDFCNGKRLFVKLSYDSPIKYPSHIVVSRAYHRLHETEYNLGVNNCENFVRWCRSGGEKY